MKTSERIDIQRDIDYYMSIQHNKSNLLYVRVQAGLKVRKLLNKRNKLKR